MPGKFRLTDVAGVDVVADGRIVVGGSSDAPVGALTLLRFLPNGRLDPAFGAGGVVQRAEYLGVLATVPLPDGGLVAFTRSPVLGTVILRIDATGRTIWTRSYVLGRPTTLPDGSILRGGQWVLDAALAGDKILFSGSAGRGDGFHADPMLARLNLSDGSLDRSFAGTGWLIAPRPAGTEDCSGTHGTFASFVVRPDGSIVAGGAVGCGLRGESPRAILRAFTTTGQPLPGFPTDPETVRSVGPLRAGPGGSLSARVLAPSRFFARPAFARFGVDGALAAEPVAVGPEFSSPVGFEIQRDGRFVISGGPVMRYLPDGRPDLSFGRAGAAATGIALPVDIALQPDGKILIVGQRGDYLRTFTLRRLLGGTRPGLPVVLGRRAAVRRRRASIHVTCRGPLGSADCRGTAQLTSTGRDRSEFSRARAFTLALRAPMTLRIALNATARRRLARAWHRRLSARLTVTGPAGTTRRRVALTAAG